MYRQDLLDAARKTYCYRFVDIRARSPTFATLANEYSCLKTMPQIVNLNRLRTKLYKVLSEINNKYPFMLCFL